MKSISTAVILLLAASLPHSNVLANPNGAGTCATGKSIARGHGGTGTTFVASNLILKWGGAELNSSATNTIAAATDHTFTLVTSDDSRFKGFLLRLSGKNGATASSTTFVAADSSLAKVTSRCAPGVIGITHRSNSQKSGIAVTLNHPEAAELLLEVTVVTTNRVNWAYEAFDLSVSSRDDAATASPTVTPTESGSAILGVSTVMMLGALFLPSFAMM